MLGIRIGFSADPDPGSHPDPDPGQTLPSQTVNFFSRKRAGIQVCLIILVKFLAPGSGSGSAFRNADPDPQHCQKTFD